MLPLIVGNMVGATGSGQFITRTGSLEAGDHARPAAAPWSPASC